MNYSKEALYETGKKHVINGQEVIHVNEERQLFTPKEMSRFSSFVFLINTIDEEEHLVAEGQNANFTTTWESASGQKGSIVVFHIDDHLLGSMNRIANNMYNGNPDLGVPGLRDDPRMKQIADQALQNLAERKAKRQQNGLQETIDLWNRE